MKQPAFPLEVSLEEEELESAVFIWNQKIWGTYKIRGKSLKNLKNHWMES